MSPPQVPPLWKIYATMPLEPTNKPAEITVAEFVQEKDPEYLDAESVEALDPEDYEAALFQLGGDSDQSEELPGKAMGKDDRSKTRNDQEEVIQDIKGA